MKVAAGAQARAWQAYPGVGSGSWRWLAASLALSVLLAACAGTNPRVRDATGANANPLIRLPGSVAQAALVIGRAPPGSVVRYAGRRLRIGPDGSFVFGVGRAASGVARVEVVTPDGRTRSIDLPITPREWKIEDIQGVPEKTVNPPPEIAARIQREQAMVATVRERDDPRADFLSGFIAPVGGRQSGWFGSRRSYNGTPGAPHSGMDIAAPMGALLTAPAAGSVTFANPDLYLTGGTVVIDHGYGISSSFLHLSRIDVKVGDRLEQGQPFAAVGATGRATGPHMHWGVNWFDVRLDPQLLLEGAQWR